VLCSTTCQWQCHERKEERKHKHRKWVKKYDTPPLICTNNCSKERKVLVGMEDFVVVVVVVVQISNDTIFI
jgi:hypothetical protein